MKIKIFGITVFWLMSCLLSAQGQTNKPCGCEDKEELLNLLNQIQMGIQEFKFQLDLITAQEKAGGKPVMLSENGYKKFLETVTNAERAVGKKGLKGGEVSMDVYDCSIEAAKTGNSCVQQVKTIILRVHQKICKETLPWRNPETESYLERREMKKIIQEFIAANEAAGNFIIVALKALPKDCRPNDWFGYVVYQQIKTIETNRTTPPKGTKNPSPGGDIIEGGNTTQTSKTIYIGTVLVEGGKMSSARASAAWSYLDNGTVRGRTYCSPTKPDVSTTINSTANSFGEGEQSGTPQFNFIVSPATREFSISMKFFPVTITGQATKGSTRSGGCYPESPVSNSSKLNLIEGAEPYSIKGKITPQSPDYLEGSQTERPPHLQMSANQTNISANSTFEIQVRWMLRRLPAR